MRNINSTHTARSILFTILIIAAGSGLAFGQFESTSRMLSTTIMSTTDSLFRAQTGVIQQRKSMAIAAGVYPAGTAPSTAAPPPQQIPRQFPITATDFRPASGPIVPNQLADSATGVDPQTREQMRKLFQQALTSFEAGARKNNLANAFAFITAIALKVRTGQEPTNAQADQLITYFNNVVGGSPAFRTYDARQLQTLYESLVITGNIIALLDAQANNPQLQAQAKEMSRVVLKQFLEIDA